MLRNGPSVNQGIVIPTQASWWANSQNFIAIPTRISPSFSAPSFGVPLAPTERGFGRASARNRRLLADYDDGEFPALIARTRITLGILAVHLLLPHSFGLNIVNYPAESTSRMSFSGYPFADLSARTSYSLCTKPPLKEWVATWRRGMSRGTGPNNGMPAPINTGTRVITNRSMHPAARNR